ncbi:YhfC family glutamic-type intramembrane protease [Neobacillus drentensis]|uniref:YhfC family intramembrane metalloprotease n=1 Tax=Neobacillus drentensis TaxID=220684 RepID=UPI00300076DD
MVSTAKMISMFVPIVFAFILFIGLIWYYRKKMGVAVKPLIVGAIGFVVFTQVLEKALHLAVITAFPHYADHPWAFGLYGGLAAGLFEEFGRFLLFTWLLKKFRDYKSGISFGIGWGGIEAILLVLMTIVPNIMFAFMMNAGTLEKTLGGQIPAEQIAAIKDTVLNNGVSYYFLGCVERFFAVFMQIAFSLWVLIAVVKKKFVYVVYVILIHAAIDLPLVFVQTGHFTNLWVVELYIAIVGLMSFWLIKKARGSFQ